MKKLSLLGITVMSGFLLFAQNADFGLKGGLNLATWSNNNSGVGYQNRAGFNAGLFAQIHATPQIAIQPEVVYSSQGTKYTFANQEHNLALNYVNIPVMVQALVGGGLLAQVGPQIGFLTSVTDKVGSTNTNFFTTSDFKSTDVALGFGLGFSSTSGLGIDGRYNLGLTNINENASNTIKNNVLQLDLTYKFSNTAGGRTAKRRY